MHTLTTGAQESPAQGRSLTTQVTASSPTRDTSDLIARRDRTRTKEEPANDHRDHRASGQLGRATADRLLELLELADVVLVTREPDKLDAYERRGAVVRRGDFDDPASLPAAFAGVERLLLISTDAVGRRVSSTPPRSRWAKEAGVRHLRLPTGRLVSDPEPAA
jgi:hypothetical protein